MQKTESHCQPRAAQAADKLARLSYRTGRRKPEIIISPMAVSKPVQVSYFA